MGDGECRKEVALLSILWVNDCRAVSSRSFQYLVRRGGVKAEWGGGSRSYYFSLLGKKKRIIPNRKSRGRIKIKTSRTVGLRRRIHFI